MPAIGRWEKHFGKHPTQKPLLYFVVPFVSISVHSWLKLPLFVSISVH